MSDSVRPHRRQPTRLPHPWDSPGKNTGVGCRFLLLCMKVKSKSEVAQSCLTLVTPWTAAYQAPPSMGFSRQKYWSGVPLPSPKTHFSLVQRILPLLWKHNSLWITFTLLPYPMILPYKIQIGNLHLWAAASYAMVLWPAWQHLGSFSWKQHGFFKFPWLPTPQGILLSLF